MRAYIGAFVNLNFFMAFWALNFVFHTIGSIAENSLNLII